MTKTKLSTYHFSRILILKTPNSALRQIRKLQDFSVVRCGPPEWASFSRHSGILNVSVGWRKHEKKFIQSYNVRYKTTGEEIWNTPLTDKNYIRVDTLNSNMIFVVQIKCVQNSKCSQCPWSDLYVIPPELITLPILIKKEDHLIENGSRLISLTWKTVETERPDGYCVSIQKASGELPIERFNTSKAEITLHLSCSEYIVRISAFNNVSASPELSQTINRCEPETRVDAESLNVTVHSNTSFTIYWEAQLLKQFVCYSPYKRYTLSLHTRQNKETCNLQHINGSESTFGSMQFYFMEGTPVRAPNITNYNVTSSSLMLQWSSIPEEELRGFLQGYVIYYKENINNASTPEKTLRLDAGMTSFEIKDLKPYTLYQVEISAFTRAGAGTRSNIRYFKTYKKVYLKDSVIIIIFIATIVLLTAMCPILKRMKAYLWPSIPNPQNSNAIQKIEKTCEIELLESLQTLKMEEWHTNSLQIIEEETKIDLLKVFTAENNEDSELQEPRNELNDTIKDSLLAQPENLEMNERSNHQTAFIGGYTTLEMFQQTVKCQCSPTIGQEATEKVPKNEAKIKPALDYVGQFCSSPTFDSSIRL
ncbi:hypothetical protein WMY93_021208 [Mugilogobius chulae]|uniref:Fibronectin type-III domain-containing protein n=1 Tax=Mugilogobius chulae TaxID=88201 RepID=A0AAW0NA24_9GOBI